MLFVGKNYTQIDMRELSNQLLRDFMRDFVWQQ